MPKIALNLLIIFSVGLFIIANTPSPIRIEGDGVFYYSWLHTIVWDHDINVRNQLEQFARYDRGSQWFVGNNKVTATNYTPNAYPFGSAIMWLPFVLVAQLIALMLNIADGYSWPYVLAINFSGVVFGIGAAIFIYLSLKRFVSQRSAIIATAGVVLATPWIYYQQFEPFMSHVPALFVISAWWYLVLNKYYHEKSSWLLVSLLTFLIVAIRWQNMLLLIAYVPLLWPVFAKLRLGEQIQTNWRELAKRILIIAIPVVIFWLIQMQVWHIIYGSYFLTPQGTHFVRTEFHLLYTLFSTNRGVISWSPIFALVLVGLGYLWKREKVLAMSIAGVFILQWVLNSSLNDLGGGDAFGGRRYIETLPFLALPLALVVEKIKWKKLITILIVLLIIWNLMLIQMYREGIMPRSGEINLNNYLHLKT
ncbi:MAG: hypothetical protein KBB55_02015 [Candidatus Buchananbacteria bacterium]|nr:hypothetical protein [Candidatus Buchananbacteria bacterium]